MQDQVLVEEPTKPQGLSEKTLLSVSAIISTYFLTIFLLNFLESDIVFVGVLREILTVPMLLGQLAFLVMGITILIKRQESKLKYLTVMSILLLTTSSLLTIGSFFY